MGQWELEHWKQHRKNRRKIYYRFLFELNIFRSCRIHSKCQQINISFTCFENVFHFCLGLFDTRHSHYKKKPFPWNNSLLNNLLFHLFVPVKQTILQSDCLCVCAWECVKTLWIMPVCSFSLNLDSPFLSLVVSVMWNGFWMAIWNVVSDWGLILRLISK